MADYTKTEKRENAAMFQRDVLKAADMCGTEGMFFIMSFERWLQLRNGQAPFTGPMLGNLRARFEVEIAYARKAAEEGGCYVVVPLLEWLKDVDARRRKLSLWGKTETQNGPLIRF